MSGVPNPDGVPHTFPAAVIGGFGVPARGRRAVNRRYNAVAVRKADQPDKIFCPVAADNVSRAHDEYALEKPPAGVSRNVIDKLWKKYEPDLPDAILALEEHRHSMRDWEMILSHVHGQGVRSRDFLVRAAEYLRAEHGITNPTRDQLQVERIQTLLNTPEFMKTCRFAVVRRPSDGPRFVANIKGYAAPLEDTEFGFACVIFPLSPEVAVLMVVGAAKADDNVNAGPMRDLTMTPAAVDLVNEASWRLRGIDCVFGHPDDQDYILRLDASRLLVPPAMGPYRGTGDVGLCDWAVLDRVAHRLTIVDWRRARTAQQQKALAATPATNAS
jgi:hypothetical protein